MSAAPLKRLFDWKIGGVRWVDIIGLVCVGAMLLSVYAAKAGAAREGARIAELERQIADNGQRVRLLRAEVARLEQPARLEALSRRAGLGPIDVRKVAGEDALARLAPEPQASEPPAQPEPAEPAGEARP